MLENSMAANRAEVAKHRERLSEMARKKRTAEDIKEYHKQYREKNRNKMREYAKTYRDKHKDVPAHLERKYGITVDDKIAMYAAQDGKCGVCGEPMAHVFDRNCQVEHDHTTGKVRSLSHWYCNIIVGVMEKRPVSLDKVVNYLQVHRDAIVRTHENNNHENSAEMSESLTITS